VEYLRSLTQVVVRDADMTFRSGIFADRQHIASDDKHRLEAGKSVAASRLAGDRCLRWSSSKEVEASLPGPRDERLFVSLRGDRGFAGLADLRVQYSPSSRSVQPETSLKASRSVVSALEAGWRESFARTDLPGGSCSPNPYGSTERSLPSPSLSGHPSDVEVVPTKQSLVEIIRNRHKDAAGPDQQASPDAVQTPFRSSSGSEAFAQVRRSASSEPQDSHIRDAGSPVAAEVTGRKEVPDADSERKDGEAIEASPGQCPPTPRQVRIQTDSRQSYSPEVTEALRERVAMLETLLAKGSPLKVGKGLPPPRQDEESSSRTLSEDSVAARSAPVRTPVASQRSRSVRISNQSSCFDSKSGSGSPRCHEACASDSSKHSVLEKTGKADSEGTSDIAEGEVAPKSAVAQGASPKSVQKGKGPPPPKGGAKGAFSAPPAPGKGKGKGKPAPPKAPPRAGAKAGLTKEAHNPRKAEIQPRLPMKKLFWNAFVLDDEHLRSCENVWAAIEKENADLYSFDMQELEQLFAETSSRSGVQTPVSHGGSSAVRRTRLRARVFEESRRRQVCIMLARLPPVETTVKAIHDMDDDCLDKDQVELLLATAPTAEELTMLHAAAREMPEKASLPWDDAEDFVWKLAEVGHFLVRLQTWSFENAFEERFHIFHSAVTEVKDACHALRDSHRIPRLLGITLNVGNYLNAGTSRGRADGFSVEVLSQMRALKGQAASSSSASTLLDFVVTFAHLQRKSELSGLNFR